MQLGRVLPALGPHLPVCNTGLNPDKRESLFSIWL